jgi:hypothetical protein
MNRTVGYLVARQDEHLTIRVGQEFSHTPPVEWLNKDAIISKKPRHFVNGSKDEVHESRRIELVNGIPSLTFAGTDYAGAYEAKVSEGAPIRFAAQANPEESNLDSLTEEQYRLLGEVAHVVKWTPGTALGESIEKNRVGTELWLPLAMLAILLAAGETLLAHWFSKPK